MLALLLDEMISPVVASQLLAHRSEITIESVHRWQGGAFLGMPDEDVLRAALAEGLTLVSYDASTISPLVTEWATLGISHAGVIFVNERTSASSDFGGLIRALIALWESDKDEQWADRIEHLRPA